MGALALQWVRALGLSPFGGHGRMTTLPPSDVPVTPPAPAGTARTGAWLGAMRLLSARVRTRGLAGLASGLVESFFIQRASFRGTACKARSTQKQTLAQSARKFCDAPHLQEQTSTLGRCFYRVTALLRGWHANQNLTYNAHNHPTIARSPVLSQTPLTQYTFLDKMPVDGRQMVQQSRFALPGFLRIRRNLSIDERIVLNPRVSGAHEQRRSDIRKHLALHLRLRALLQFQQFS